jgi:hypothetical protein
MILLFSDFWSGFTLTNRGKIKRFILSGGEKLCQGEFPTVEYTCHVCTLPEVMYTWNKHVLYGRELPLADATVSLSTAFALRDLRAEMRNH